MRTQRMLVTALLAAALCVMAPFTMPIGPVAITLAPLGVYLAAGLLGPAGGCAVVGLYLALGGLGVPVFAGFSGGLSHLFGPTGGFLWGYLLCALVSGLLCRLKPHSHLIPVWLLCGTLVLYGMGCGWFAWQTDSTLWAMVAMIAPCLPGDLAKIAVATGLILSLRGRVRRLLANGIKEQRQ